MNHRLILSTDSEHSDIYVYQSKEASGKNLIEIYSYENQVDRGSSISLKSKADVGEIDESSSIPKLPKQIQEV
jgi:hypothetical protein